MGADDRRSCPKNLVHLKNYLPKELIFRAIKMALPISGAYLVIVFGLLAELVIVGGELGGSGVAAVGLAGTFSLLLVLSFHALEIAAQAIISRRYGEGNFHAAGACLDNALLLSVLIGVPLTGLLYFLGPVIFKTAESRYVEQLAIEYFNYRLPGIPFVIAILVMIGFFNAISRPQIPMYIYGSVLIMNAVLCYGFVEGKFGLPQLGIGGAGLAQTIAAIIGFVGFLVILMRKYYRERYQIFRFQKHASRSVLRRLLRLAWPVFVQQFLGNFGMFLFALINSKVPDGGISLSAATIARNIGYLTYLPSLGFGIAAATIVGQYLGAGNLRNAERGGYICWLLGALLMTLGGLVFLLFREPLVNLFLLASESDVKMTTGADDQSRVAELAVMLLVIVAIYQPLEAVNTIIGKALQGAGDTMFVMIASVACQWGVFLPLAWYLALPLELGAYGALYAMAIQLSVISLLFMFKYRGESWKSKTV